MKKSMWIIVLPWKSFCMIGEACTKAEAEYAARLIWPSAYCE